MKKYIYIILLMSISLSVNAQKQGSNRKAEQFMSQGLRSFQWGDLDRATSSFEEATKADPKSSDAYYLWALALTQKAEANKDEKTYRQAFEKYEKSIKLNPDQIEAYNSWACVMADLGKEKKNVKKYAKKIESLLKKYEQHGQQTGAYNLACLYSLINKKEKAMEWLYIMMNKDYEEKMLNSTRRFFDSDTDFDNIRDSNEFIEFLNRSFPDQLPDRFQAM